MSKAMNKFKFLVFFQTVTSDLEASFRLSLTARDASSSSSSSSTSERAVLRVKRLRGRLNLAALSRERIVVAKMDGWPEVRTAPNRQFDKFWS